MTYTINGIGTRLCGSRELTQEEYNEHVNDLPYRYDEIVYRIATKAFVVLFLPICPLETIIYANVKKAKDSSGTWAEIPELRINEFKWIDTDRYFIYQTYHVNWDHVKHSVSFYIMPTLLILWYIWIHL